ncbi:MAG: hypothetical protein ACOZQL_02005 [Myxococcota bacterium]
MRLMTWSAAVFFLLGCTTEGEPALDVTVSRRTTADATPVRVHVVATTASGKIGTGTVKIKSEAGSLSTPVDLQLDAYGTVTAELICDPVAEPACAQAVRVTATWTSEKKLATGEVVINSGGSSISGSSGGVGGTGGSGTSRPPVCSSNVSGNERPNGCCIRRTPHPFSCDAVLVSDGQTITRTYFDTSTGENIQVPLRFFLPPVANVDECKAANYGFLLDFSAVDGGLINGTVDCAGGNINTSNKWVATAGGACPSLLAAWAYFDCERLYDPMNNLTGTWQALRLTADRSFTEERVGNRTFQLRDAGAGTVEEYIVVLKKQ